MGGENLRFVQNFKGELVGMTKERGAVCEVSRRRVEAGGAERWAKSLRLTKRFTSSVGIRRHLPLKGKATHIKKDCENSQPFSFYSIIMLIS